MPYQQPRTSLGARRSRLHFLRLPTEDDGMGGQTAQTADGWIEAGHAWGRVTALDERHREALSALQLQGRAAYHIDVAYRAGVAPAIPGTWRIRWGQTTLEVQSVVDDTGHRRRLVLLATEVQT